MNDGEDLELIGLDRAGPGNTTKQAHAYIYWSFTWNNYELEQIGLVEQVLRHECSWYIFQEEVGKKCGTPHLQGNLKLRTRKRWTEMCKLLNPKIHWEKTKSVSASVTYCTKQETRSGQQWIYGIEVPEELKYDEPYGWQMKVMDIIQSEPERRTIHWFYEFNGNKGKSSLAKYLCIKHNALITNGKKADMFFAIKSNPNKRKIILIDVPRSNADYINYGAIEEIKNGLIFSGKYESQQVIFNTPHVIIFANHYPDTTQLSQDRWKIWNIDLMIAETQGDA